MQETWEEGRVDINGFDVTSLPACPSTKGGRPSGGLVIAISLKIQAKLTLVNASIFAITALITGKNFELVITNVYLPPGGNIADLHNKWGILEEHLTLCHSKYPNIPNVIAGDFNARIATNWESLIKAKWWITPEFINDLSLHNQRLSKDKRVNEAGTLLYQLVLRLNLVILNGNCPPDVPGEFTHISSSANSVLDYMLVSHDIFPKFSHFKVENIQLSDHLPLVATMTIDWTPDGDKHPTHLITNSALQIKSVKWSELQAQKYSAYFQQGLKQAYSGLIENYYDYDQTLRLFSNLSEDLTSFFSVPTHKINRTQRKIGALWFNSACKQARQLLGNIYKEYKASGATVLPKEYFQAKSAYKQIQKGARQEWQVNQWRAIIEASSSRNSRQFWLLVNKRTKRYPLTIIPAPVWESYLKNYFATTDCIANTRDEFQDQLPLWPPTDPEDIHDLIVKLKTGKAPGPDLIPAEAIKYHADWWAKVLATIFDAVNNSGKIPEVWKDAVIVPIHKKGSPDDPGNYRNISLLSIVGKLYARFLLNRLNQCAEEKKLIGPEQAGFRPKQSTINHILILQHLAWKYSTPKGGQLCVAFIDLKAAFDSIPRSILWEKLSRWGIDRRLLWLIIKLHENSAARVRLTPEGDLTNPIPINRGVRQGCILAPFLFNLFISDMRTPLIEAQERIHAPRLALYRCPLLLYADDAVILSFSRVGLRRALKIFGSYCNANSLTINYGKSKILIFSKSRKLHNWRIDGRVIEQVYRFQYLGVWLQHNLRWKAHVAYVTNRAKAISLAILRFFFTDGALHIPSALKVFKAKVIPTIAYAISIWGTFVNLSHLEVIQNQFLRGILKLPNCVSNTALRMELNTVSLENALWKHILCHWLSLWHNLPNLYLIQCMWRDDFQSPWVKNLQLKITAMGISPSKLLEQDIVPAKRTVTCKLEEMDLQQKMVLGNGTCSPLNLGLSPLLRLPNYLNSLTSSAHRYAFVKARFNTFPSNMLRNRFSNGQISLLCDCNCGAPESLHHIIFDCAFHSSARSKFLAQYLKGIADDTNEAKLRYLLNDDDPLRSLTVARFLISVLSLKKRNGLLCGSENPFKP